MYAGRPDRGIPLKLEITGSIKKMKRACAAEPKELTTKMSNDCPFSRCLVDANMRSLKMVASAGKNMDPTNMHACNGSTCTPAEKQL